MFNECIAALKTRLEEITSVNVFGPERVIESSSKRSQYATELRLAPSDLPAIVLDYTGAGREEVSGKAGKNSKFFFSGNILVCVFSPGLTQSPISTLTELVYGTDGVYKKLQEIPGILVGTQYLTLDLLSQDSYPSNFNISEEMNFYYCQVIPCNLQYWIERT